MKTAQDYEPDIELRKVANSTASSLRRALAHRNELIIYGAPDVAYDGKYREDKISTDFLKSGQLRHYAWMLAHRGQHVAIDCAPRRECQTNPDRFPGLKTFPSVEAYLMYLDSSDWTPRDGWGLVGMWRELVRLIPEAAGSRIAHLYPDVRQLSDPASGVPPEEPTVPSSSEAPGALPKELINDRRDQGSY